MPTITGKTRGEEGFGFLDDKMKRGVEDNLFLAFFFGGWFVKVVMN